MNSEEKIIPITRGARRPKQGCFAVIAGTTRVDVGIEAAQPVRRRPAAVVQLVSKQGRSDATGAPASKESSQ
jgi:hypothetical protein